MNGLGLLSLLIILPTAGALVILFLPREKTGAIKALATVVAGLTFVASLPLWFARGFRESAGFLFREDLEWIPSLGVRYSLGVDGIAALLILLTTLLSVIAIYSSYTAVKTREKEYYVFLLLLETGMIGVFCALDFFLFYVFWEVMLVPMYFLIGVWGGARKLYAAIKFFLYTLFGSVIMLLAIIALYFFNTTGFLGWKGLGNAPSFDILHFHEIAPLIPADLQLWVFWAFFLGFAIKVPMFPFHTWLPDAHVEAPTAGSVILAGVLLKMGTYGFLRFSLPICPSASARLRSLDGRPLDHRDRLRLARGDRAEGHEEARRLLLGEPTSASSCWASSRSTTLGLQGGVLQIDQPRPLDRRALPSRRDPLRAAAHPADRPLRRDLAGHADLRDALMIIFLASIGLPLLNGFVGEFTILVRGLRSPTGSGALLGCLGVVLGAAYMLWLYQRVFFGELKHEENKGLQDVNLREIARSRPSSSSASGSASTRSPSSR
jgi:NADH-quinone oxidoreductase subunit M